MHKIAFSLFDLQSTSFPFFTQKFAAYGLVKHNIKTSLLHLIIEEQQTLLKAHLNTVQLEESRKLSHSVS